MKGQHANAAIDHAASHPADVRLYRAPGRVNIIGEHTDYNEGLVLPTSTAAYTWLAASARSDRLIRIESKNMRDTQQFGLDEIDVAGTPSWIDYAKGVAAELQAAGIELSGAEMFVDSDIPISGGLSSSASFEIAIAIALLDLAGATLAPQKIAQLCQRAEIRYAGVNCGIMDQLAVASCPPGEAMLIDCRTLGAKFVAIPADARLLITDSGVKHELAGGGYNNRAEECVTAVAALANRVPGLRTLRDLSAEQLERNAGAIGDTLLRRCRHVVSENERVEKAYAALATGKLPELGTLINASHASLRDDYEVSCDEIEQLVRLANACDGVFGSRMVGGGFGGCVLSLTTADNVATIVTQLRDQYGTLMGREPWMHVVNPAEPAGIVRPR
jgi:galactokinase